MLLVGGPIPAIQGPASAGPVSSAARIEATPSGPVFPTPIRHVVIIMDENVEIYTALQQPFLSYLAHTYAYADNFFAVKHNSLHDYIAATSGSLNMSFNQNVTNIGDLANAAGASWAGYFQSMPYACDESDTLLYGLTHNPFAHYWDIGGSANRPYCLQHILNLNSFVQNYTNGTEPNYSWITPNEIDDGHGDSNQSSNASIAANWLDGFLSPLINDTASFSDTAFILTYDEGYGGLPSGTGGGQILTVVISPYSRTGYASPVPYNTYSLLTTAEWLLGLGHTGLNDSWSEYLPMYDMFTFMPLYPVTGSVTNSMGQAILGANLSDTVTAWTSSHSSGTYSLLTANSSFTLTASAPGYSTASESVTVNGGPVNNVDFVLASNPIDPSPHTVSGTVMDQSTGSPIVNALVAYALGGEIKTALSEANGSFAVGVPNGHYIFNVGAQGYLSQDLSVNVTGGGLALPAVSLFDLHNMTRVPVTGRVLNVRGLPIADATVTYASQGVLGSFQSNSNGYLSTMLPYGNYSFTANDTGYLWSTLTGQVAASTIQGGGFYEILPFFNIALTYTVNGTVVGSGGAPIPDATVGYIVYGNVESITTNAQGQFAVLLPTGTFGFSASAPGYAAETLVTIVNARNTSLGQFQLPAKPSDVPPFTVTGQVVSSSFLPVIGANVTYSVNGTLLWTLSDAMGDFSVLVPNGTYTFTATYPGDHPGRTSVMVSGSNVNAGQITLNTENRLVVAQPTMSPPRSDVGHGVNFSAIITGGTPPYAVIWNGLPSGCASADSASVQCTPSDAGTFNITVQATDATNAVVVGPTLEATIAPALSVTVTAIPAHLFTGQVFNLTANATGGIPPLSYAWAGLPNGCLSTDTSLISCFPTYAGLYNVSVTVSDDIGNNVSATAAPVSILVSVYVSAFNATRSALDIGQWTNVTLIAHGGRPPTNISWYGLPAGCASSTTSMTATCRPTQAGSYSAWAVIEDATGALAVAPHLVINVSADPTIGTIRPSLAPGMVNDSVQFALNYTSGSGTDSFNWTGLPPGCSIPPNGTPVVQCVPTQAGSYNVSVVLTDSNGVSARSPVLSYTVNPATTPPPPPPVKKTSASGSSPDTLRLLGWVGVAGIAVGIGVLVALVIRGRRRTPPPELREAPAAEPAPADWPVP
jgi:hypothetical protein